MIGKTTRAWIVTGAIALGATAGAAGVANAASGGSSQSSTQGAAPVFAANGSPGQPPGGDPAKMRHGPGETVLTGATASKVRAAALAAVPRATVIRVETDSAGAAYEVHLRKSDGTFVTVKLDKGFHVTGTQSGFGAPPQ